MQAASAARFQEQQFELGKQARGYENAKEVALINRPREPDNSFKDMEIAASLQSDDPEKRDMAQRLTHRRSLRGTRKDGTPYTEAEMNKIAMLDYDTNVALNGMGSTSMLGEKWDNRSRQFVWDNRAGSLSKPWAWLISLRFDLYY